MREKPQKHLLKRGNLKHRREMLSCAAADNEHTTFENRIFDVQLGAAQYPSNERSKLKLLREQWDGANHAERPASGIFSGSGDPQSASAGLSGNVQPKSAISFIVLRKRGAVETGAKQNGSA